MKKIVLSLMVSLVALGAAAQHEQLHVFRTDKAFNSYKWSDIKELSYRGTAGAYTTMSITDANGKVTSIDMSKVDSCVVRTMGLPEIYIKLTDYPSWTDLKKDATHTKETVYAATLSIKGCGMYDDFDELTVEFSGRGNSTWGMAKTPYKFKMEKKASVCGLRKAKSYALIANYIDCSLMRNATALWVANRVEALYSNHCVPVKVYLNGNYRGQYMLTEKIGIGGASVDIDEKKGMLFELDSNYDEDYKFKFSWSEGSIPVMVKDPNITEIATALGVTSAEYWSKWQKDFTAFANAIVTRPATSSLKDVLDLESAVKFFMVNSLANNHELKHPKSFYIHKDSIDGVYKFGPVWDFDWAFTYDGYEGASASTTLVSTNGDMQAASFLKHLFANQEFRTLYKQRWDEFVANDYPALKTYLDEYAALIEPAGKENGLLWPADNTVSWRLITSSWDFRANYKALRTWLDARVAYCSSHRNYGLYP